MKGIIINISCSCSRHSCDTRRGYSHWTTTRPDTWIRRAMLSWCFIFCIIKNFACCNKRGGQDSQREDVNGFGYIGENKSTKERKESGGGCYTACNIAFHRMLWAAYPCHAHHWAAGSKTLLKMDVEKRNEKDIGETCDVSRGKKP